MKKILLLFALLAGIAYAQPYNPIGALQDTTAALRTDIDWVIDTTQALRTDLAPIIDSTEAFSDTLNNLRTDVDALSGGITFTGDVVFGDNDSLKFGAGTDMYMYSNGTNGFFGGNSIYFKPGGTTSWLFSSSGNFLPNTTGTFDIGSSDKEVDSLFAEDIKVSKEINMADNYGLYIGNSGDMRLYHSTNNYIYSTDKDMYLQTSALNSIFLGVGENVQWEIEGASGDANGALLPYANGTYDIGSTSYQVDSIFVQDMKISTSLIAGSTNLSTTELAKLDGLTSSTAELNILDGVTADATEINLLDGKTAIADSSDLEGIIEDFIDTNVQYTNLVISYPQSNQENIPILLGNKQITELYATIQGGTSVVFNLVGGADVDDTGNDLITTPQTCNQSTRQSFTSVLSDVYDIDATSYVWLDIGTVTGTVYTLTVTLGVIEDTD